MSFKILQHWLTKYWNETVTYHIWDGQGKPKPDYTGRRELFDNEVQVHISEAVVINLERYKNNNQLMG